MTAALIWARTSYDMAMSLLTTAERKKLEDMEATPGHFSKWKTAKAVHYSKAASAALYLVSEREKVV